MPLKVAVVGNCQARPIANILGSMSDQVEISTVAVVHLLRSAQEKDYAPAFERSDVILAQQVSPDYPCRFVRTAELSSRYADKVVSWVNLYYAGYNPELTYVRIPMKGTLTGPLGDYHLKPVIRAFQDGLSPEQAVDLMADADLNRRWFQDAPRKSLEELRRREAATQLPVTQFIEENFSTRRLFFTFNHPSTALLIFLAKAILGHVGLPVVRDLDPAHVGEPLGQFVLPVNPFVAVDRGIAFHCGNAFRGENPLFVPKAQPPVAKSRIYNPLELATAFFECYEKNADTIRKFDTGLDSVQRRAPSRPNLRTYLETRFGAGAAELVRAINADRPARRSFVDPEHVRNLLPLANSTEDLIALYTIVRRMIDPALKPKQLALYRDLGRRLAERPLPGIAQRVSNEVRDVTLISAVNIPPHLYLSFLYALVLLTQDRIRRVSMVFTGERDGWPAWQRGRHTQELDKVHAQWKERLSRVASAYPMLADPGDRVRITLVPTERELADLIGDVVIRFEGPAPFNTTTVYAEAIHAARAVVTGTFSSLTRRCANSDLTLTRSRPIDATQEQYVPPSVEIESRVLASHRPDSGDLNVVTAYTQGRVLTGLRALTSADWDAVGELLLKVPRLRWRLVGVPDVPLATQAIPAAIRAEFDARIEVSGMADLEKLYTETFALLCFPRTFGGGRTAMLAVAAGVPVLTSGDPDSDIANLIPASCHIETFVGKLALIRHWVEDESARQAFVLKQRQLQRSRSMLSEKGAELLHILDRVVAVRARRSGTSDDARLD